MNFDFNKKDEVVEDSKIFEKKKTKAVTESKVINVNLSIDKAPKGFWAILIAAVSLFCMNAQVPDAGWGLFLAFLMLDKRQGLLTFALAGLGMAGMYHQVDSSGWLLFFAFLVALSSKKS